MIKTGECFWLDEVGNLWLSISHLAIDGEVTTSMVLIEERANENIQE